MKFGFYLPTCAEGTFYPRGFVDLAWIAQTVQQVEDAGFYEVSASDYVSTGKRTRDESQPPPRYLEPLNVLAWLAGHFDPSSMLFDDAEDCGQSKARAFADILSGKKGFEDPIDSGGFQSATSVRNS